MSRNTLPVLVPVTTAPKPDFLTPEIEAKASEVLAAASDVVVAVRVEEWIEKQLRPDRPQQASGGSSDLGGSYAARVREAVQRLRGPALSSAPRRPTTTAVASSSAPSLLVRLPLEATIDESVRRVWDAVLAHRRLAGLATSCGAHSTYRSSRDTDGSEADAALRADLHLYLCGADGEVLGQPLRRYKAKKPDRTAAPVQLRLSRTSAKPALTQAGLKAVLARLGVHPPLAFRLRVPPTIAALRECVALENSRREQIETARMVEERFWLRTSELWRELCARRDAVIVAQAKLRHTAHAAFVDGRAAVSFGILAHKEAETRLLIERSHAAAIEPFLCASREQLEFIAIESYARASLVSSEGTARQTLRLSHFRQRDVFHCAEMLAARWAVLTEGVRNDFSAAVRVTREHFADAVSALVVRGNVQ